MATQRRTLAGRGRPRPRFVKRGEADQMRAKEGRVALVVDNPTRDLPGLVLLAHTLASRGVVVYLVPMQRQYVELRALRPDLVVLNYLRPSNDDLAATLLARGTLVTVLDTEGGVFPDLNRYEQTL